MNDVKSQAAARRKALTDDKVRSEAAITLVTFMLEEETYALDIGQVREILEFTSVTKVPQTPDFVRGVINLRGSVVPVVDLKLKFGMKQTEKTVNTRILVTEVDVDGDVAVIGALADAVHDVVEMEPHEIGPPPKIGTRLSVEFIRGMGRKDDEFIIILDFEKVFSSEELSAVQSLEDAPAGEETGLAEEPLDEENSVSDDQ
ncbi:MAG: chemotaxis protein CheW [Deltaproteobacteria bacterium]|nr:chemotaxis protein CheW [Deltaproteobacteria bacterium]